MAVPSLDGVKSPGGREYKQVEGRRAGLPRGKRKAVNIPWAFENLVVVQVLEKRERSTDAKGCREESAYNSTKDFLKL